MLLSIQFRQPIGGYLIAMGMPELIAQFIKEAQRGPSLFG